VEQSAFRLYANLRAVVVQHSSVERAGCANADLLAEKKRAKGVLFGVVVEAACPREKNE
jgi:hypothetical protein